MQSAKMATEKNQNPNTKEEEKEERESEKMTKRVLLIKGSYFCLFGAISCSYTLLPIFLQTNGVTESKIGILSSLRPFISFWACPLWSAVADRFQLHAIILFSTLIFSALSRYFFLAMPSFPNLMIWFSIAAVLDAPISPIVDTYSMKQLKDVTKWGRIRLWGAIGFGFFSLFSGFIVSETKFGWKGMFALYWVLMTSTLISVLPAFLNKPISVRDAFWKEEDKHKTKTSNIDKKGLVESACTEEWKQMVSLELDDNEVQSKNFKTNDEIFNLNQDPEIHEFNEMKNYNIFQHDKTSSSSDTPDNMSHKDIMRDLISMCAQHENIIFFLIIFTAGFSAGIIDTFLYVYLKYLGGKELLMGTARAITCAAEIPFFHYANAMIKKIGEQGVLGIALAVYIIRLLYYSLLQYLPLWAVLPAETLHGFTFAALWAASTSYGFKIAPPQLKTTVQGLVNGIHWGVGFGSGSFIGGYIYKSHGAVTLFRSAAGLTGSVFLYFLIQKCSRTDKNISSGCVSLKMKLSKHSFHSTW